MLSGKPTFHFARFLLERSSSTLLCNDDVYSFARVSTTYSYEHRLQAVQQWSLTGAGYLVLLARYGTCECAWHRSEPPVVAVRGVALVAAAVVPVFPAGTNRRSNMKGRPHCCGLYFSGVSDLGATILITPPRSNCPLAACRGVIDLYLQRGVHL